MKTIKFSGCLKIIIFSIIAVIVLFNILFQKTIPQDSHAIIKTFFSPKLSGEVIELSMSRGAGLYITINKKSDNYYPIKTNNYDFYKKIKKGDYFIKIVDSNKCSIERGDSILYFDCYDRQLLEPQTLKLLEKEQFWDKTIINHWIKK